MKLNIPFNNHGLNDSEIGLLNKGNFHTVEDLILTSTKDIAKRCKTSPVEIRRITEIVLDRAPALELSRLETLTSDSDEIFTTGDEILDNALGGGVRTGMVWEVVGESSAGKTQLALQLSLFVQTSQDVGGLSGSTCYLTTSSKLPTARLLQICQSNDTLSSSACGLEHVHTIPVRDVAILQHILSDTLPSFIQAQASEQSGRPVKLLIIDALGELFHLNAKTSTSTLIERSKNITSLSASLHELASVYRIAVVVLNEVIDRFDRPFSSQGNQVNLLYENQLRWFNTAEFFGERKKEASLGLVWANQVNARIMLTRTGRRKYLSNQDLRKRRRIKDNQDIAESLHPSSLSHEDQQPVVIRRLTIIFSSASSPASLDYIVTEQGITVLADEGISSFQISDGANLARQNPVNPPSVDISGRNGTGESSTSNFTSDFEDELWSHIEPLDDLDWDALEQTLSQVAE